VPQWPRCNGYGDCPVIVSPSAGSAHPRIGVVRLGRMSAMSARQRTLIPSDDPLGMDKLVSQSETSLTDAKSIVKRIIVFLDNIDFSD
jgi:hypothetical protein